MADIEEGGVLTFPGVMMEERTAWGIIKRLAKEDQGGISVAQKVRDQMKEKDVNLMQVINVLKSDLSKMIGVPRKGHGTDWNCEIAGCAAGADIKVEVAIVKLPNFGFAIT